MGETKAKSLRLSFKGDKPKKRKRTSHKHDHGESSSRKRKAGDASDVEDVGGDEQAWVAVETEQDLSGPCFLFRQQQSESSTAAYCVAFQPTLQSVEAALLLPSTEESAFQDRADLVATDPKLAEELEGAEIVHDAGPSSSSARSTPTSVYQVWIATKVPGSSSPARFTFKSAEGKFLGADKSGLLRASMEARGPQEEWTIDPTGHGSWKLRSVHNRYLGLDQVAGGKTVVRAVCDATDKEAIWQIKVQWKHRHAARHADDPKGMHRTKANDPTAVQLGLRDQVVAQELETFKSRAGSRYLPSDYATSLSKEERRALRKAEKEGRLAEEMLDRRSKLKSDKYA
ncbi:putative actin-bundling protein [Pseudozyma hubeiensis]|nr:putative actin-bundling protein [Pseudozyma hubeiensis]